MSRPIRKCVSNYRNHQAALTKAWPDLAGPAGLAHAVRFDTDLREAIRLVGGA